MIISAILEPQSAEQQALDAATAAAETQAKIDKVQSFIDNINNKIKLIFKPVYKSIDCFFHFIKTLLIHLFLIQLKVLIQLH